MWKKEEESDRPTPRVDAAHVAAERPARPTTSKDRATIGRSIAIRGDVTGDEDLLIQGRVEGSVDLSEHAVTVGPEGEVKASIVARIVVVEGTVEGNLRADEQVILRSSAHVQGDIEAPRVVLEDGARFRGGVDMGETDSRRRAPTTSAAPRRTPEPEPPKPAESEKSAESEKPAGPAVVKSAPNASVKVGA